ncbi:UPF0104 family protein [Chthonobacter albigriseus]|uniref:UPF0104 family protein n=1 Tax=Chthonobacter albigriseus TaxID=1683161 RepID=UPI0015EFAF18|nr:UPF0104 family protein [Chthonobacter albigriseus]
MLKRVDDESELGLGGRLMRWVGPLVAIGLIAAASYVLWDMVTSMSLFDVTRAITEMPPWRIAAAFAATALGMVALAGYDMLAVKVVRSSPPLSLRRAAVTSLIANIFANALGLPLLSGGSARYRIYSLGGAGLSVVGRIIAMSWVTMWSGILLVLGLSLALGPPGETPLLGHEAADRALGVVLILLLAGFIGWVGVKRRAIRLGGWAVRLPGPAIAGGMVAAGAVDLLTAATALWLLLPEGAAPDLVRYIVTYTVGLVAGIASNTPGGIGVFEAAVVTGLDVADRPDVAAGLILFRLIYCIVPLIAAIVLMAVVEWVERRRLARRLGDRI